LKKEILQSTEVRSSSSVIQHIIDLWK